MEFARLAGRVAASGCIKYEQRLMRRIGFEFAESAFHFLQLGHEIRFCVLAASRVTKQKVDSVLQGGLIGVVTERSRVGAVLPPDDLNPESFCPNIELLDCSSAKGIGCREQHAVLISLQVMREFRRRCCFAGSVHADDQDDGWLAVGSMNWRPARWQNARDLRAHRFDHVANSK